MRLSPIEIAHIKECLVGFDPNATVFLFGSRTDDTKKGGDIDLLIFSQTMDLHLKLELKGKLFQLFEEQKIDIIIEPDSSKPFVKLILEEAIKL